MPKSQKVSRPTGKFRFEPGGKCNGPRYSHDDSRSICRIGYLLAQNSFREQNRFPNGRGSDSKSCRINEAIGTPTVREGLLRARNGIFAPESRWLGGDAIGGMTTRSEPKTLPADKLQAACSSRSWSRNLGASCCQFGSAGYEMIPLRTAYKVSSGMPRKFSFCITRARCVSTV